ncbi:MAG: SMC-Scp complex subunit ScpB [Actinomycetota bacterium]
MDHPEMAESPAMPTTKRAIEAILMVTADPMPVEHLAQLLELPLVDIEQAVRELAIAYDLANHGFQLVEVAGGWRYQTHPDLVPYVERYAMDGQSTRLSTAALETLSIVAYKQPISRGQVSAIRGVNVDAVLRTLVQRGYVEEVGKDPGPGQAALFGTTSFFLERVGLNATEDLPSLGNFVPSAEVVEALEQTLRFEDIDPEVAAAVEDAEPNGTGAVEGVEANGAGPGETAEADNAGAVELEPEVDGVAADSEEGVAQAVAGEGADGADAALPERDVESPSEAGELASPSDVEASEVDASEVEAIEAEGDEPEAAPIDAPADAAVDGDVQGEVSLHEAHDADAVETTPASPEVDAATADHAVIDLTDGHVEPAPAAEAEVDGPPVEIDLTDAAHDAEVETEAAGET